VSYNFGSVSQALATGRASVSVQALAPTSGFTFDNLSLFAQDTWRATSRLTVTAGLRFERNPPPAGDRLPYTFTSTDDLRTADLAPPGTPLWDGRGVSVGPRLDGAYVVSVAQQLVVRGGYGRFHDLGTGTALRGYSSYPYNSSRAATNVPFPASADLLAPAPFDTTTRPISSTFYIADRDLRLPVTSQWNVAVERALGPHQAVSVAYVGARGRDLLRTEQLRNRLSAADAQAGIPPIVFINPAVVTPTTSVFVTRNAAESRYHALQVQFQRRLSRGVQALAAYTLSESRDTVSNEVAGGLASGGVPGFPVDPDAEWGPSDFDVRHVVSAAVTWQLPAPSSGPARALFSGWGLDLIGRWRSATPLHVVTQTIDPLNFSGSNRRVDLVAGVDPWIADPSAPGGRRLNFAAFRVPAFGVQGTMGRNSLRWRGASQVDLSLRRAVPIAASRLEFRIDVFNVTNTPNFAEPSGLLPAVDSPLFGVSTRMLNQALGPGGTSGGLNPQYQIGGPRSVQASLRLVF
jgi:hypothetical protein